MTRCVVSLDKSALLLNIQKMITIHRLESPEVMSAQGGIGHHFQNGVSGGAANFQQLSVYPIAGEMASGSSWYMSRLQDLDNLNI